MTKPRSSQPDAETGSCGRLPRRPGCRFRRYQRVMRKADFDRILHDGVRATDERITMWTLPNGLPHPRLGLIVGRQHGAAVRRNRIKRVLREAFRLGQHELPAGFDLVCTPRAGVELTVRGCQESLRRLAARLVRRCSERRKETGGTPMLPLRSTTDG